MELNTVHLLTKHPWMKTKNVSEIDHIISIGYSMYSLMKNKSDEPVKGVHPQPEHTLMAQQFTALHQDLHETRLQIRESLQSSQKRTVTSSLKGKDGEQWVIDFLRKAFPDDSFVDCAKMKKSGDIHMIPANNKWGEMLIESKYYKGVVSGTEVQKFYRDLERTGKPLGLFISLSSSISRIKRLEIKRRNGAIVMFIPNAITNQNAITLGLMVLQHIYQFEQETNTTVHNLESMRDNITENLASFDEYIQNVKTSTYDMEQQVKTISSVLMDLRRNLLHNKVKAIEVVDRIRRSVNEGINGKI